MGINWACIENILVPPETLAHDQAVAHPRNAMFPNIPNTFPGGWGGGGGVLLVTLDNSGWALLASEPITTL